MKQAAALGLLLVTWITLPTLSQQKDSNLPGKNTATESPESSPELAAIRAESEAFVAAFNKGDAKAVAALWTEDAQYTDETGLSYVGRDAIEKSYAQFFTENRGAQIRIAIDSLRLLSKDAAIEEGHAALEPAPAGAPGTNQYTAVHVKLDGKWFMASVRDTRIDAPTAVSCAADLEWLVGTWVAEEHGIKSESTCRWVADGRFLERSYTTTQVDGTKSSGVQLVGWDPEGGHVQSWNFSPDGGHAAGSWIPQPGGWSALMRGVTGDGALTTSINLLNRLDDQAYVWQSVQRTLAGVALPDTGEIVWKRQSASR